MVLKNPRGTGNLLENIILYILEHFKVCYGCEKMLPRPLFSLLA